MARKNGSNSAFSWEFLGGLGFCSEISDVRGFGKRDLISMIRVATGEEISDRTFYRWLSHALVGEAKPRYGKRDAAKLLQFAAFRNLYGSCAIAKNELVRDLQLNPSKYPQESENYDYVPYQQQSA